jgi:hypothetical protein
MFRCLELAQNGARREAAPQPPRVARRTLCALAVTGAAILFAAPDLAVESLALHQFEDGPLLPASYQFLPGETAHFSCRLKGFQAAKTGEDEQSVKLSWSLEVFDPAGIPLEKPQSGRIESRLLPEDKNWVPKFLAEFMIPPFAPSGSYRVAVRAKDEVGGGELQAALTLQVRGREVEPSSTLVARNFRFLSGEDDAAPLPEPVYHPGEMLWARFDITGYQFGAGHRFSVDYGLRVESAEGKQLFAQPEAAAESHESFYPQRYVPGALSLSLDNNVPAEAYTLVVTIHDKIGNQTWEQRQAFQVRPR